jgi:hypothetical protein
MTDAGLEMNSFFFLCLKLLFQELDCSGVLMQEDGLVFVLFLIFLKGLLAVGVF